MSAITRGILLDRLHWNQGPESTRFVLNPWGCLGGLFDGRYYHQNNFMFWTNFVTIYDFKKDFGWSNPTWEDLENPIAKLTDYLWVVDNTEDIMTGVYDDETKEDLNRKFW